MQPLFDMVKEKFDSCDFSSELSLGPTTAAAFMHTILEEQGWRSAEWIDGVLDRYWQELNCAHDEIRNYTADTLEYSSKFMVSYIASNTA